MRPCGDLSTLYQACRQAQGRPRPSPSHGRASTPFGTQDSPREACTSECSRPRQTPCHGRRGGENHNVRSSSVSHLVEVSLRVRMSREILTYLLCSLGRAGELLGKLLETRWVGLGRWELAESLGLTYDSPVRRASRCGGEAPARTGAKRGSPARGAVWRNTGWC